MEFEDSKIQKKVWICERSYEMSMLRSEEESFDAVVKVIQDNVLELRNKFQDKDTQDILVMTLIKLVTKMSPDNPDEINPIELEGRLSAVIDAIEQAITPPSQ